MATEAGGMTSPTTGHLIHAAGAGMRGRSGAGVGGGMVLGGDDAGVEGPLSGLGDGLTSVLHGAGYKGPQAAQDDAEDPETTPGAPDGEPTLRYPSDADPASQGVVSVGGDFVHARSNGDGTSNLRYMGPSGAPAVPAY